MSEIKPALTAEEWARERKSFYNRTARARRGMMECSAIGLLEYTNENGVHNGLHIYGNGLLCNVNAPNLPALAALCLHEQPFGFTREDVKDERQAYHDAVILARHYQDAGMERERLACRARAKRHMDRADRIEALLSPEGS